MTAARPARSTDAALRPARRCTMLLVALLVACAFVTLPGLTAPASAAVALSPAEQDYVNRVNQLRAGLGLGALTVDANLTDLARNQTNAMATQQHLFHTPDLVAGVSSNWAKLGENVGFGTNSDIVFPAFVASPHHYENLVDPAFTHIGVGVVTDPNGIQWTTHRFMDVAPPPFVPPAPVAQPAPVPAPMPVAQTQAAPAPQPRAVPTAKPATTTPVATVPALPVVPVEVAPAESAPAVPAILSPADPSRVSATLMALHAM